MQVLIPQFWARPAVCISHKLPCVADPAGLEGQTLRTHGSPSALQSAGVTGGLELLVTWLTFTSAVCLTSSLSSLFQQVFIEHLLCARRCSRPWGPSWGRIAPCPLGTERVLATSVLPVCLVCGGGIVRSFVVMPPETEPKLLLT